MIFERAPCCLAVISRNRGTKGRTEKRIIHHRFLGDARTYPPFGAVHAPAVIRRLIGLWCDDE